jgi:hypothetical protein
MEGQFLINNNTIANLIHGQPICLQYQTTGCWFVVIAYDNGDSFLQRFFFRKPNSKILFRPWFFRKASGKFESVTNVYSPEITMWGIGWGIKKLFNRRLRINFFNTVTQTVVAHTPTLPTMPEFRVNSPKVQIYPQIVTIKSAIQPRILNTEINTTAYDDYSNYKANHHSNNTIN